MSNSKLEIVLVDSPENTPSMNNSENSRAITGTQARKSAIKWTLVLGIILAAVLMLTTYILQPLVPKDYLIYLQVAEVIVVGYFIILVFSTISYRLVLTHCAPTANSIKSLVRTVGAIIVIAFVISYLSQNPIIAASISTISGLVIGFASSNLIGNVIARLYLAITRPFRIGNSITVFGQKGTVTDISLLYTRVILDANQDEMLAPNSSMVGTWLVLVKGRTNGAPVKTI